MKSAAKPATYHAFTPTLSIAHKLVHPAGPVTTRSCNQPPRPLIPPTPNPRASNSRAPSSPACSPSSLSC